MQHQPPLISLALILGVFIIFPVSAGVDEWFKQLGAISFGSEFDAPKNESGNQKDWAEMERWVNESMNAGFTALARADRELDLLRFQNYFNALGVHWDTNYLTDPRNIGNLNAYSVFSEFLSKYLQAKTELVTALATVSEHYAILRQVDPKQLSGPFQLGDNYRTQSYSQQATNFIDKNAHRTALATNTGKVEKYSAELQRAIDYGLKLESAFRNAAGIDNGSR